MIKRIQPDRPLKLYLAEWRERRGMSQEMLAERMGTTKSAVSRLEGSGKHAPSLATLRKYAQAVDCQLQVRLVPQK